MIRDLNWGNPPPINFRSSPTSRVTYTIEESLYKLFIIFIRNNRQNIFYLWNHLEISEPRRSGKPSGSFDECGNPVRPICHHLGFLDNLAVVEGLKYIDVIILRRIVLYKVSMYVLNRGSTDQQGVREIFLTFRGP